MDRIRKALDMAREERSQRAALLPELPPALRDFEPQRLTRTHAAPARLLESNRILDPAQTSPAATAFRMLRTQVLQRMAEQGWRSLAVLSPNINEGKTTTAINLGISLAYDHQHTALLVDFDLRQPAVARTLGINPAAGVEDVIAGDAGVPECMYQLEGVERFVVMPARNPVSQSSETISGRRSRALIRELRERYPDRIVVFDLPPIMGTDDALAFLPLVDCGLMVVAEGLTRREDLVRCMELTSKLPIVGTVLNRSSALSRAYG